MGPLEAAALPVLSTFLPPLLFLSRLRNAERSRREPRGRLFAAFLWGALVAVLVAVVGEQYVLQRYAFDAGSRVTLPWVGAVPPPPVGGGPPAGAPRPQPPGSPRRPRAVRAPAPRDGAGGLRRRPPALRPPPLAPDAVA